MNEKQLPVAIEHVRSQFAAWREQKRPRERIPEGLWRGAAAAAQRHGVHAVSRAVSLDASALKRRVEALSAGRGKMKSGQNRQLEIVPLPPNLVCSPSLWNPLLQLLSTVSAQTQVFIVAVFDSACTLALPVHQHVSVFKPAIGNGFSPPLPSVNRPDKSLTKTTGQLTC